MPYYNVQSATRSTELEDTIIYYGPVRCWLDMSYIRLHSTTTLFLWCICNIEAQNSLGTKMHCMDRILEPITYNNKEPFLTRELL